MKYNTKSSKYFTNYRPEMQEFFPPNAKTMLDVGCGNGAMTHQLKEKYNIETWGVEFMEEEAKNAATFMDKVIMDTAENSVAQLPDNYFDVIYFNDVLEHLANPNDLLKKIKSKLKPNGVVISSIPNVRYHKVFKNYVFGKDWKYTKAGIMDFTHLRFFTSKSIQEMYREAGYQITEHKGINKTKSIMPYLYNILLLFTAGDMFYVQYATVARAKE